MATQTWLMPTRRIMISVMQIKQNADICLSTEQWSATSVIMANQMLHHSKFIAAMTIVI